MPKGSPELIAARRNEIIEACEKLYETKSFKDITIAMIADKASFTRGYIYTFFLEMFGIYAYAVVASKQRDAVADAEVGFEFQTSHELIRNSVRRLLN